MSFAADFDVGVPVVVVAVVVTFAVAIASALLNVAGSVDFNRVGED